MRAITYATKGYARGCNGTILGVSRMNMPGHPTDVFVLVPCGNAKLFDVYAYGSDRATVDVRGNQERRVAAAVSLEAAITVVLAFDPDTLEAV